MICPYSFLNLRRSAAKVGTRTAEMESLATHSAAKVGTTTADMDDARTFIRPGPATSSPKTAVELAETEVEARARVVNGGIVGKKCLASINVAHLESKSPFRHGQA